MIILIFYFIYFFQNDPFFKILTLIFYFIFENDYLFFKKIHLLSYLISKSSKYFLTISNNTQMKRAF